MNNNVSVIIPTYNEKENISEIIFTISKEVYGLKEIIIVDDNSPDMTWRLVQDIGKVNSKVKLIRRLNKKGLPSAIWEGIISSQGSRVLWLDADFLSLPFTLTKLIDNLNDYDIVVASRYVEGAQDIRLERIRVIASRLFNRLAKFILQAKVNDLTSGYILAKRELFNRIDIRGVYGEYCVRFLYQAEKKGLKIKEVPYVCLSRPKGKSKTSGSIFIFIRYCLIYILTIFKLRICYQPRNPS